MQQINFYLPEFRPNREPFRSSHIMLLLVVVAVLLAWVTINSTLSNASMLQTIEQETVQVQAVKNQLQEFSNVKRKNNVVELDHKIIQLKNEIARRQQLLQVISYQRLGNDQGFSAQLEAMARQSNPSISLEIFSLKNGTYLELVGKTTSADKLPAYISSLKSEEAFNEVSFGVVSIQPVKNRSGHLQFVVAEPDKENSGDAVSAVQVYINNNQKKNGGVK